MTTAKILITGDFDIPPRYNSANLVHLRIPNNEDDIIKHLLGIQHYIIGGPEYVNDSIMSQAAQLKHVVVMGTGTNSFIDLEAAKARKIKVDNTPVINADAVAEFALGSIIINLANSFHSRDELLNGVWYQKPHKTLSEVKLGIIGLGEIGTRLTDKIKAISPSTEISYFSRTQKENLEKKYDIKFRDLLGLAKECDIIILCVAYNEASHHIINADFLNSAKKGIILFNFSNPMTIDYIALNKTLSTGIVNFAFFDGYYDEWIYNKGRQFDRYGLLNLGPDKFIATSHIASQANHVISEILDEAFLKVNLWHPTEIVDNGSK